MNFVQKAAFNLFRSAIEKNTGKKCSILHMEISEKEIFFRSENTDGTQNEDTKSKEELSDFSNMLINSLQQKLPQQNSIIDKADVNINFDDLKLSNATIFYRAYSTATGREEKYRINSTF